MITTYTFFQRQKVHCQSGISGPYIIGCIDYRYRFDRKNHFGQNYFYKCHRVWYMAHKLWKNNPVFWIKKFKAFLIDVVLPFYTRNLYPNLVADLQFAVLLPDDIKFSQEKRSIKTSMASDRQSSLDFCHFLAEISKLFGTRLEHELTL